MNKDKREALKFRSFLSGFFSSYLPGRRSEKTIEHYRIVLAVFVKHISDVTSKRLDMISFRDITKDNTEHFMRKLGEAGLAPSTCNNYLSVVRSFMKYASREDIAVDASGVLMVAKLAEPKDLTVRFMEMDAIRAILAQPDRTTFNGKRDHLFLALMYDTGARFSEMIDLRIRDFILKKGGSYALIENGKGNKTRKVPITDSVAKEISAFIEEFHRDSIPDDYLFYRKTKDGKQPLSKYLVGRHLAAYSEKASALCDSVPANVTCHMFRHSRAMHLYRKGMSLAMVGQLLGHTREETTLIYAYADTEMKRKAIEKAVGETLDNTALDKNHRAAKYDEDAVLISMGLKS